MTHDNWKIAYYHPPPPTSRSPERPTRSYSPPPPRGVSPRIDNRSVTARDTTNFLPNTWDSFLSKGASPGAAAPSQGDLLMAAKARRQTASPHTHT